MAEMRTSNIDRFTGNCELNAIERLIKVLIHKTVGTATLAKVVAVHPDGTIGGWVDVLPLVGNLNNEDKLIPETTIFHLPYFRSISGTSAVVIDPTIGDIGVIIACEKNITGINKQSEETVPPNDRRTYDYSDAIYFGGIFGKGEPTNFVHLDNATQTITVTAPQGLTINTDASVEVNAKSSVKVTTPTTTFDGNVVVTGTIKATKEIISGSINLTTHRHSGVSTGSSNTGQPV